MLRADSAASADRWRGLSDQDKDKYKQLAQQKTEELRAQDAAAGVDAEDGAAQDEGQHQQQGGGNASLPLGTVKKIMMMDKEVSRASADGVRAVALAAEVFLGLLGSKCAALAKKGKRRTILLKDFEQAVRYDKRLVEAGLKDVIQEVQQQAEAAAAAKHQKQAEQAEQQQQQQAEGREAAADGDEGGQKAAAGEAPGSGGKENAGGKAGGKPVKKAKAGAAPANNHSIKTFFARTAAAAQQDCLAK